MASTAPSATAISSSAPNLPTNQTTGDGVPPPISATPSSKIPPPVGTQVRDPRDTNGHAYIAPTSASPQLNPNTPIDARVRNPVPSKLKGRIDGRNGNFGVMHMDLIRPDITERDLAAKRSSEGTEAAARLANKEGYRAVKRTRWMPPDSQLYPSHPALPPGVPNHLNTLTSPPAIPPLTSPLANPTTLPVAPQNAPITTLPAPVPVPTASSALPLPETFPATCSPPNPIPSNPATEPETTITPAPTPRARLSPAETKTEQARLLTLLRSLDPSFVAEQLCKALVYFGGTPGAPAPTDGLFPESMSSNGSGSSFVSWVAEIFPQLSDSASSEQDKTMAPIPMATVNGVTSTASIDVSSVPTKRGRGRPKGSTKKSKEEKEARAAAAGMDVVDGSTMSQPMHGINDANDTQPGFPTSVIAHAALIEQNGDASYLTTPGPRKRGRPKGSKNKPKSRPNDSDITIDPTGAEGPHQSQNSMIESPLAHKTSAQAGPYHTANDAGVETEMHILAHVTQQNYSDHTQTGAHTSSNLTQDTHYSNLNNQTNTAAPRASSWTRKNSQHSHLGGQDTPDTNGMLQTPGSAQNHTAASQAHTTKRRRVSREANKNLSSSNMESPLSGPGMLASPLLGSDGQPLSPAKQLRHGIGLIIQEEIHRQQHHQPPDIEQQSPNLAHGPPAGMQRNQSSRSQGRPQAAAMPQGFFQPRQMPNQYGHGGNASERFGRNMGPNQFQHHMMNSSPNLGNQLPPPSSQQQQTARSSHTMSPFQNYGDQSYLEMDYSSTPASFSGHPQLEAALTEPSVGERMFHTMGRR